ncbi:MAG: hypothetical protein Fur002_25340 [Anaerolineales bacterium]
MYVGLLSFVFTLAPLVFIQRLLHREIQAAFIILTRSKSLSIALFSLLFLPGVFLHELSHFLMAKLLGVRTGRFSLIPAALPDGRLQLGYVETASTDVFRDSLIGLAPLLTGSLFIAYAGVAQMRLDVLWSLALAGNFDLFWRGLLLLPQIPDFYFWSYLIFVVSSSMMPSASDRHSWLPLGVWSAALLALALFAGAGSWMLENLAPALDEFFRAATPLFGLSVAFHLVLLPPAWILHRLLTRITGLDIKK